MGSFETLCTKFYLTCSRETPDLSMMSQAFESESGTPAIVVASNLFFSIMKTISSGKRQGVLDFIWWFFAVQLYTLITGRPLNFVEFSVVARPASS